MKSYLNLVPISAKVHKRQNRMTILCIIISVLLVTTIFSGADMMIRTESIFLQKKHGSWHIQLENPPKEAADKIIRRLMLPPWDGQKNLMMTQNCLITSVKKSSPVRHR